MERLVSGDQCLYTGYWLLSTSVSCLRDAGDVHPFVSKKMICKYKCWQEGIMNKSDNK